MTETPTTPEEGSQAADPTVPMECDQAVDSHDLEECNQVVDSHDLEECNPAVDSTTPEGRDQVADPNPCRKPGHKAPGKAKTKTKKREK